MTLCSLPPMLMAFPALTAVMTSSAVWRSLRREWPSIEAHVTAQLSRDSKLDSQASSPIMVTLTARESRSLPAGCFIQLSYYAFLHFDIPCSRLLQSFCSDGNRKSRQLLSPSCI